MKLDQNEDSASRESIAIIGGGMMGIVAAINLAKSSRFRVTLFEKEDHLGGLCSSYQWQDLIWDRFYHVFLSTDSLLVDFVTELNLHHELFWKETKVGFYSDGKLASLSSTLDFIMFPFMSLWQKFRMGLGILYCNQIKDPAKLDKIYVRDWLTKVFGRRVYKNIWEPLLRSKLGDARERTSAAFIWAAITRLYGARGSGSKREKMGHVRGGYHTILTTAEKNLSELGVKILLNTPVLKVEAPDSFSPDESGKTQLQGNGQISVITSETESEFDEVLFTVPCPIVSQILGDLNDNPYWQQLHQVEYLSMACVFLVLTRKLSPYYTINLLDKDLPFTGIIEVTNVVSPEDLGGRHLVYLPKYMPYDDPINNLKDEQIIELFVEKLKKMFPELKEEEILHKQIFREKYDQPLQALNYLNRAIGFRTPLPGVYLVNTSMIYNSTLNNNAVVSLATKAAETILNDIANE